ncbi:MAG: hypothetical protein EHM85_19020 [Desulfobacteraceae bacterium]|nr:MAG: hypothetical protein EHM85_19020 [Desulfobacteraceae bacterium]
MEYHLFLICSLTPPQAAGNALAFRFKYPEWLIMFIAVLSVKMKLKAYVQIHRMAVLYWEVIAKGLDLTPISERQLRERLKKILHFPGKPAAFIFQLFPELDQ